MIYRLSFSVLSIMLLCALSNGQTTDDPLKLGMEALDDLEYKKAVKYLTEAIQKKKNEPQAYYYRALSFKGLYKFENSIADLNAAIKLDPKYAKAFIARGMLHYIRDDVSKAIGDLSEAVRLEPKSSDAFQSRGLVFSENGQYAQAIQDFSRLIELDPKDSGSYLPLARLLSSCPDATIRSGKKALDYASTAYKLSSQKDPLVLEVMAASYAELDRYDDAIKWQKKAIEFIPRTATPWKKSAEGRLKNYVQHHPLRYKRILEWANP